VNGGPLGVLDQVDQGVTNVEVNGTRIGLDFVELDHQDCVVLGRSLMFYSFSRPDGGISNLPAHKLPFASRGRDDSSEPFIHEILGEDRANDPEQLQLARVYYGYLQHQNLDADGTLGLKEFLLKARHAAKMVEEANDITTAVRRGSGLRFELNSLAPMLGFGFGAQASLTSA